MRDTHLLQSHFSGHTAVKSSHFPACHYIMSWNQWLDYAARLSAQDRASGEPSTTSALSAEVGASTVNVITGQTTADTPASERPFAAVTLHEAMRPATDAPTEHQPVDLTQFAPPPVRRGRPKCGAEPWQISSLHLPLSPQKDCVSLSNLHSQPPTLPKPSLRILLRFWHLRLPAAWSLRRCPSNPSALQALRWPLLLLKPCSPVSLPANRKMTPRLMATTASLQTTTSQKVMPVTCVAKSPSKVYEKARETSWTSQCSSRE